MDGSGLVHIGLYGGSGVCSHAGTGKQGETRQKSVTMDMSCKCNQGKKNVNWESSQCDRIKTRGNERSTCKQ